MDDKAFDSDRGELLAPCPKRRRRRSQLRRFPGKLTDCRCAGRSLSLRLCCGGRSSGGGQGCSRGLSGTAGKACGEAKGGGRRRNWAGLLLEGKRLSRRSEAFFEGQLLLAKRLCLPVIIHDREAHGDTMELLQKHKPKGFSTAFRAASRPPARR